MSQEARAAADDGGYAPSNRELQSLLHEVDNHLREGTLLHLRSHSSPRAAALAHSPRAALHELRSFIQRRRFVPFRRPTPAIRAWLAAQLRAGPSGLYRRPGPRPSFHRSRHTLLTPDHTLC